MTSLATRAFQTSFVLRLRVLLLSTVLCAALAAPVNALAPVGDPAGDPPTTIRTESTPASTSLWTRPAGEDWPGFLGSNRDGKSSERGITTDWSQGLPLLWVHEIGEGYSAPTVAAGRVFIFDRQGDSNRLTSRHAETGDVLWRSEYPTDYEDFYGYSNGPRAAPLVDGDRVYTFGAQGRLRCHRLTDGKLLWEIDTTKRFGVVQNFFGVGSAPSIEGNLLIAQVGGSPPGSPPLRSGKVTHSGTAVVAFDKITGDVVWKSGDDLASYAGIQVATLADRRLALSFSRSGLLGLDSQTGEVAFQYPWRAKVFESVNASTPVVLGDRVFITETYGPGASLLEIGEAGLEVVWKSPEGRDRGLACHWNTPIHVDNVLYGSSGRHPGNAQLMAVDATTGRVLWQEPGLQRSSLLFVDGHFVVLSENGVLRLVRASREKFDLISSWEPTSDEGPLLDAPAWNAPVLSHGILYVRGKSRLVAMELIRENPQPTR